MESSRFARRIAARCVVATVFVGLAGCASLDVKQYEQLQEPKVELVGLRLLSADLHKQDFVVTLKVDNPNHRGFTVGGADLGLALNGQTVAKGVNREGVSLPPLGSAQFDVVASANALSLLQQALQFHQQQVVDYSVSGGLALLPGVFRFVRLPFRYAGKLRWEELEQGVYPLVQ